MNTDHCRLSIAATGAFWHPLGDQTPIDCRYGELIDTPDLPSRLIRAVSAETVLDFGGLQNPRAVIIWNVSGQGIQRQPTEEEAAAIAAQVLHVDLIGPQEIRPAKPGGDMPGNTILWPAPGTRVVLRPATAGVQVMSRVLVIPGSALPGQ